MVWRCVGGQWPPLRFSNEQTVYIRCSEDVAPYGKVR